MLKKSLSPNALYIPIIMVGMMWLGYLFQSFGFINNCEGAIVPLQPGGIKGVLFSPFLHGNLDHIFSNSVPMLVLLFLLYQFYPTIATKVFTIGWVSTGLLVWSLPPIDILTGDWRYNCVIGASGLVYVLAFFLFFSGIFRRNRKFLTISLVVALYYGGLIWGMIPQEILLNLQETSNISWQSHLAGGVVGLFLAFIFRKSGERKKKFIWEFPNYYNEKDDLLWQDYIKKHPEHFLELPQKKKDNIWSHLDKIREQEKN